MKDYIMKNAPKAVYYKLRNKFTDEEVITSSLSPRRDGDYGDLIQVFEQSNPNRKFWVTENAFDKIGLWKEKGV